MYSMNYSASLLATRHSLAEPNEVAGERGLQTHMAAKQYRKIEGPAPGVEALCAHDPPWGFCVGFPKSKSIKIIPNIHFGFGLLSRCSGPWVLHSRCPLLLQDRMSLYIVCMRPIEFILCCLFCVLFFLFTYFFTFHCKTLFV